MSRLVERLFEQFSPSGERLNLVKDFRFSGGTIKQSMRHTFVVFTGIMVSNVTE